MTNYYVGSSATIAVEMAATAAGHTVPSRAAYKLYADNQLFVMISYAAAASTKAGTSAAVLGQ